MTGVHSFLSLSSAIIMRNSPAPENPLFSPIMATNYSFHFNDVLPQSIVPASDELIAQLRSVHEEIKNEVTLAQHQQALYYNQHRQPTPDYKVNDYLSIFLLAISLPFVLRRSSITKILAHLKSSPKSGHMLIV